MVCSQSAFCLLMSTQTRSNFAIKEDVAFKKVCKIHRKLPQGGILLFLTGKQEVIRMVKKLRRALTRKSDATPSEFRDVSTTPTAGTDNVPREMDDEELDGDAFQSDAIDDYEEMDAMDDPAVPEASDVDGLPQHATILPLYSLLSSEDQAKIFAPVAEDHRLIVVATNVSCPF